MLQASRSTGSGNVPETMRPPGIKRSTLFRRRDTCSAARRFDSRINLDGIQGRRVSSSDVAEPRHSQMPRQSDNENNVRNLTGGYRPRDRTKFESRINEAETAAEWGRLDKSKSKNDLESGRVLNDTESWEWKVSETPIRSPAMSKLKSLRRERADVLTGLRSSLQKMLKVVREMRDQRSR